MKLAEQLVVLRKEKGWTQAEAARIISIQQSYLSKLENGHFVPSEDVLEKLSKAYGVKLKTPRHTAEKPLLRFITTLLLPLLGVFMLISGSNALLFSSTYYTYKAEPVAAIDESELYLNYHLSDTYKGEKYVSDESGTKYHFELIATREVERKENKLLTIFGIVLILISVGLNINRLKPLLKRFLYKDAANS